MIKETISKFSKIDINTKCSDWNEAKVIDRLFEELFDNLFKVNVKSIYLGAKYYSSVY